MRRLLQRGYLSFARLLATLAVPVLLLASPAHAAFQIYYSVTDLADATPGEDLWQYDYVLTGYDFATDDLVEVLFPEFFYAQVEALPAGGWDTLVLEPDPLISYYSFLAGALEPRSSPQSLAVKFVWLGGPSQSPGSQRYSLFAGAFDDPLAGFTVAGPPPEVIPEPDSMLLLLAGLVVLYAAWRARTGAAATP